MSVVAPAALLDYRAGRLTGDPGDVHGALAALEAHTIPQSLRPEGPCHPGHAGRPMTAAATSPPGRCPRAAPLLVLRSEQTLPWSTWCPSCPWRSQPAPSLPQARLAFAQHRCRPAATKDPSRATGAGRSVLAIRGGGRR